MSKELEVTINQIFVPYRREELQRWRAGDPSFVPDKVLRWNGPGRENGYGFAEFTVERYLSKLGYRVINNEYNLFANKVSKFEMNNKIIEENLGCDTYHKLKQALVSISQSGQKIWQPDLFIAGENTVCFAEAKRDRDHLQPGQALFSVLIMSLFSIPFVIYKVLPQGGQYDLKPVKVKAILPAGIEIG